MQNREANNIEDPVRGMVAQCASWKKKLGHVILGMVTKWRLLKNYVPLISLPSGKADDFIVAQPLKC